MFTFAVSDTHGDFEWLMEWCKKEQTTQEDILILLGDSALRFEGENSVRERYRKNLASNCPITIFVVRGNHDRPFTMECNKDTILTVCPFLDSTGYFELDNILMWHDKTYPNIWYFNEENPVFYFAGKSFLVLPGAYSVDKEWRKIMHWTWYKDEQLSHKQQLNYLDQIHDRSFNFVLSHTCPLEWQPKDLFISGLDQSKVDDSTERWLSDVKKYIGYEQWFFAHYHSDRDYGKIGDYDWHGETTMIYKNTIRIV